MKILLTGSPGVGKSTAIASVLEGLKEECFGVVTQEVRTDGVRVGFAAWDVKDRESSALLAHLTEIRSPYSVGDYSVDVSAIDTFCVAKLLAGKEDEVAVVDEIGRMQSLGTAFFDCVRALFKKDDSVVLATIVKEREPFAEEFRSCEYVWEILVTTKNRDLLPSILTTLLRNRSYYRRLNREECKRFLHMASERCEREQWVQLGKLVTNAVVYAAERRYKKLEGGLFEVHGEHGSYSVSMKRDPHCDCNLAKGEGGYEAGECSHVQALKILGEIPL